MRVLRTRQVVEKVGYSAMHLSRLEKAGRFPKRFKLNPDGQACGWLESEINDWIQDRVTARDAAAEAAS